MTGVDISRLGEMLAAQSLFADCANEELAEIVERGQICAYDAGEEIMAQGEEGDALFILLSGVARVSMLAPNGREIVLDYAEAGEVLGEIAMIDGGDRTASVHAFARCEALRLARGAFGDILANHPKMAMRLLQAMARRLRISNATIEAERAYTSGPRLARFLLRLMIGSHGVDENEDAGGELRLALSQGELGNFAGMSREQINRQLSAWVENGVVELRQGRVTILDRQALMDIAEEW